MIDSEGCSGSVARSGVPWRRALEVFDDYDGGGVLSEQLADDLVNELAGLGPRPRGRARRGPEGQTGGARRSGPHPTRPAPAPAERARPRLTLVRGGG